MATCRMWYAMFAPAQTLAAHPEINKHVTRKQLASFCDPMNNLGQAGVMVDRVLASLRP